MLKIVLFTLFIVGTSANATCAAFLRDLGSQADQTYASGFTPRARGSVGYISQLYQHDRMITEGLIMPQYLPVRLLVGWLHMYSYIESMVKAQAIESDDPNMLHMIGERRAEHTVRVSGPIDRLLTFEDDVLLGYYDELIAIAGNLSASAIGHEATVPLFERMALLSLDRNPVHRRALVNQLTQIYLTMPAERDRFLHYLPEVLAQARDNNERLAVLSRSVVAQVSRGGEFKSGFFGALVDQLPNSIDLGRIGEPDIAFIDRALKNFDMVNHELSPAQRQRVAMLTENINLIPPMGAVTGNVARD